MKYLGILFIFLIAACASDGSVPQSHSDILADKPYGLRLDLLAALDPRPLRIGEFSPDPDPQVRGIRVLSFGRAIPVTYEVINAPARSSAEVLLTVISNSLNGHDDIVVKELSNNDALGAYLHYFQRVSVDGKPHHVSSNYLFVRNGVFFHLAATSYGPTVMPRDTWGAPAPDRNAEREATLLLAAFQLK